MCVYLFELVLLRHVHDSDAPPGVGLPALVVVALLPALPLTLKHTGVALQVLLRVLHAFSSSQQLVAVVGTQGALLRAHSQTHSNRLVLIYCLNTHLFLQRVLREGFSLLCQARKKSSSQERSCECSC